MRSTRWVGKAGSAPNMAPAGRRWRASCGASHTGSAQKTELRERPNLNQTQFKSHEILRAAFYSCFKHKLHHARPASCEAMTRGAHAARSQRRTRSEERRVGKECRYRGWLEREKK